MRIYRSWIPADYAKLAELQRRRQLRFPREAVRRAESIVELVRRGGDVALIKATARFDRVRLTRRRLRVPRREFRAAWRSLSIAQRRAMRRAWRNILAFHAKQRARGYTLEMPYGTLRQMVRPLHRVGIHIPARTDPLVSTLLMCAGAARVAGVRELVLISPPRFSGTIARVILAGAYLAGIDEAYPVGGAQGVAALSFGTKSIPAVDKVVGPGNVYTQAAKMLTQGGGSLEGPSEILVLADGTASPAAVAADLIAQAEHTGDNWAVLVTPSKRLVLGVLEEIKRQLRDLDRAVVAAASLSQCGAMVLVRSMKEGLDMANLFAPEHLEIVARDGRRLVDGVRNAGTVLLGGASPVAAADYGAGPNHVLPTAGTARFASGLGVRDFMKLTNVTALSPKGLKSLAPDLAVLARMEGLEGHARSMEMNR